MSERLEITKERVLAAASKCKDAEVVLKELFPEAFEDKWEPYLLVQEGYTVDTTPDEDATSCFMFEPGYRYRFDSNLSISRKPQTIKS